jgi:hypothetical protein
MDRLPGHRRQILMNLERAISYGQKAARDRAGGQASLFGGAVAEETLKPTLLDCEPFDPLVELSKERAAVGFFLSGHPFQEYRELIDCLEVGSAAGAARRGEGTWVDLVGVITSHTKHRDRHKRVYARAHFEDRSGVIGLVVYANLYEQARLLVESDSILVIGGRVQVRSDGLREVVADRITRIDEVLGCWTRDIFLQMDLEEAGQKGVDELARLFAVYGRPCEMRPLGLPAETAEGAEQPEEITDPELQPEVQLAQPVPLVVEVQREGTTWLLKSGGRRMSLTLDSLRELRRVPGATGLRLRAALPTPVERKQRFTARG